MIGDLYRRIEDQSGGNPSDQAVYTDDVVAGKHEREYKRPKNREFEVPLQDCDQRGDVILIVPRGDRCVGEKDPGYPRKNDPA